MMWIALLALACVGSVRADYNCVCNSGAPVALFATMDAHASPVGVLGTSGCKPTLQNQGRQTWIAIISLQELTYVQNSTFLKSRLCAGQPDPIDVGAPSTTTSSTLATTSTATTTTRSPPTTTRSTTTTSRPTKATHHQHAAYRCPHRVTQHTQDYTVVHGSICYEYVEKDLTWQEAEHYCNTKGGHLFRIDSYEDEQFIIGLPINRNVWMGLHDHHNEGIYSWISGGYPSYTKWMSYHTGPYHQYENCVVFRVHYDGVWDDILCSKTHSSICQYDAVRATGSGALIG